MRKNIYIELATNGMLSQFILFAKDGEIYNLEGLRHIAIGGAYSVDKFYRIRYGGGWWPDEQPSAEIKAYVKRQLRNNPVDVILSHTCPFKYHHKNSLEVQLAMATQNLMSDLTIDE